MEYAEWHAQLILEQLESHNFLWGLRLPEFSLKQIHRFLFSHYVLRITTMALRGCW